MSTPFFNNTKSVTIYKSDEVFGISRDIPANYVTRKSVDIPLIDNLSRNIHIALFGSSKQGKTSLRKKCIDNDECILVHCSHKWTIDQLYAQVLKTAGYELSISKKTTISGTAKITAKFEVPFIGGIGAEAGPSGSEENITKEIDIDLSDVNDIIKGLDDINFHKYIILEDFHYLPHETQKDFAIDLKAFHENSKITFVVIGVWLEENRLIVYNGDLTGRCISINADKWNRPELKEVISEGENLLNIKFDDQFIEELIENSNGSVYIVQETCLRACKANAVEETEKKLKLLPNQNAILLIKNIVNGQSARYKTFISSFSEGFQETGLQMYKWLLYPILTKNPTELEEGVNYSELRRIIQSKHPKGNKLNAGSLIQALNAATSLQLKKSIKPIIIDYDQTNNKLNIVDRWFIIWLKYQNVNDLLELADLTTYNIDLS